jgi:hypothetical protein
MIGKLKKTTLGKALYHLSRNAFGGSLRRFSTWLQSEAFQLENLASANRKHNRTQIAILEQFEAEIGSRR